MEWQRPEALYLILPVCLAWYVVALNSDWRRQRAREAFAEPAMWSRLFPAESRSRFWAKMLLRELAIVAGLVALAGPRFGTQYEQVVPRGADLYVLIDVSRSMLADDVPPSRLGRAKADVSSLLNRLQGERVGLIAFAGQAVVKCPLTVDYDSFRRSLEELDPDSAPRGGTAIGDAIRKGLEVFLANSDRDQAMLLITDGDDQQSYPLEAAAVASERQVAVFTVGLGDADRGARIPQKANRQSFVEYQGEQVWSKLDGSLLEQIALKTSGIYVPAGTRTYDLGELYTNHLQGRQGKEAASQQRIRRSERFQLFLAIALVALLIDLWILPYRSSPQPPNDNRLPTQRITAVGNQPSQIGSISSIGLLFIAMLILNGSAAVGIGSEPDVAVRDGLRFYSKDQFEEARSQFAAASEELDRRKSKSAAIAAFDEACAAHRKGDLEHARECYLRAGLSQDRTIATSAHFNLGTLSAEKARTLCGDKPELVPAEKRTEILDHLAQAIVAYRHCLELQSDHAASRRNIELVRQWIKYYSDQWRERDRQKRRDESNLIVFLEYVIQAQSELRDGVKHLSEVVRADTFAELKRVQEELRDELPTLREKIANDLRPQSDPKSGTAPAASKELEEGILLLQSWVDTAGEKMSSASHRLGAKEPAKAASDQQLAIDELDRVWESVIPFLPLLAKVLADQTVIARTWNTDSEAEPNSDELKYSRDAEERPLLTEESDSATPLQKNQQDASRWEIADDDLVKLEEAQLRTMKRTRLLVPKAESELSQLEKEAKASTDSEEKPENTNGAASVDPEQIKSGYRQAIELAPLAVEQMESAVKSLKQKDRLNAARQTEAARKLLEEIQRSQPKNEQKQDQNKQDQKQNEDPKPQDNKQPEDQQQPDEQKKQEQKDQEKNRGDQKKDEQHKQPQVSQDRVEEALRKVRERQQEKRERDRKLKGQFIGKSPVDKDW